jgi:hypothetical protein
MIKLVRLVRRDPGLTPDQFKWRWILSYGPWQRQAVASRAVCRVTASFLAPKQIDGLAPLEQPHMPIDFDAIEQLYFTSRRNLERTLESGLLADLAAGENGLCDNGGEILRTVMLEETMALRREPEDGAAHRVKTIRTLTRRKNLDMAQFRDYWHNHHQVIEQGGIRLGSMYRINVAFSMQETVRLDLPSGKLTVTEGEDFPNFDAFMEPYYLLGTDVAAAFATRAFPPQIRRDEINFLDLDAPLRRAVMDEFVIANSL